MPGENEKQLCKEELAAAVMQYLEEHPQAMDTFEGIAEWWVARQQVRFSLDALARVLQELAAQGLIEEMKGAGEVRLYHLVNKKRPSSCH
jgi:Fe2+ or Zn2+ uptake regulation protein